jgi:hypothetical protein
MFILKDLLTLWQLQPTVKLAGGGPFMEYKKVTRAEVDEMIREANKERAVKAAATRRVCRWLRCLYNLEDPRGQVKKHGISVDVDFLERLYRLEDTR